MTTIKPKFIGIPIVGKISGVFSVSPFLVFCINHCYEFYHIIYPSLYLHNAKYILIFLYYKTNIPIQISK